MDFQGIENLGIRELVTSKVNIRYHIIIMNYLSRYIFAIIQTEKIEQRGIVKVGFSVARHVDRLNKFDMFEIFD